MLLRGMVRMHMARRLRVYRMLSLVLCSLALVGWGAFADLRAELAQLKASQDQLLAERIQPAIQDSTDRPAQDRGNPEQPQLRQRPPTREEGRTRAARWIN